MALKDWLAPLQACIPFFLDTRSDNVSQPSLWPGEAVRLDLVTEM